MGSPKTAVFHILKRPLSVDRGNRIIRRLTRLGRQICQHRTAFPIGTVEFKVNLSCQNQPAVFPNSLSILPLADQLGDAVQSLISAGLREVMSWGFDKIYQTTHKEYHSSDPAKGWGNIQVVGKGGKEGVWDNVTHKWYVRPGKYDEFLIVDPYNCAARKEGKWGLIEATDKGRELVPCQYDEVLYYTRYGVGAPIAFGVKDQGGNMHWMIGLVNLEDGKYQFTPFRGEWCSVDFTYKPSPKDGEPMVAILAKDAKTGHSQVLDYFGKPIFGYRSDEQYDNVFLTGMVEKGKLGDQDVWYDFYRVEKGGKTGFVFHEVTADYKRFVNSFELLPCEYDEISPLGNVIGWKEAKRWNSGVMGYNGKNLVIAQKNGRYGVGSTTRIKNIEGDLPFTEVSVMKIPFHGEEKLPVVIGKEPDGRYVAMHPDGSELYGWGVKSINQNGEGVLEYGSVNGYVLKDVIDAIEENLRLNPRKWNLTDEEVKILKGK